MTVAAGSPSLALNIANKGRDLDGSFWVDLRLTNTGTGHARNVNVASLTLQRLTGTGAVSYNAARSGEAGFPDMLMAAQAKIFTSESAIQVVNDALQFFGARGYSRELPLERMARDVRMFTIGGGTAEVLRNVVAGAILKKKLPQTRDGWVRD